MAERKGGACLSTTYEGKDKKLRWRCSAGHEWEAVPHHIRHNNTWCPHCAHRIPRTIADAHAVAATRKGRCLSERIVYAKEKLSWQCLHGHKWYATLGCIVDGGGRWCPYCAGKYKTIEDAKIQAQSRGGTCLSSTYQPGVKLEWQCSKGHTWEQFLHTIKVGYWCPHCAGRRTTIADMQKLAESKGGNCLSTKYTTCMKNLTWECSKGHTWEATPLNVRRTSWCPNCKLNKRERACRRAFEQVYKVVFPKVRPEWLVNSRGNRMELDGYSKELELAFEYQGIQHYEYCHMHRNLAEFEWQQQRDREKVVLCEQKGVRLIQVPWTTKDLLAVAREGVSFPST